MFYTFEHHVPNSAEEARLVYFMSRNCFKEKVLM